MRPRPELALAALLAACGPGAGPEQEIRELVAVAEAAAESRDAGALRGLIADDYGDADGRGAADLRRLLQGWLIAHQSVHLLTRVEAIELTGDGLARVELAVGMLGREAGEDWSLAGDVYRLDLRLARDGGEWRVTRAAWRAD